MKILSLPRPNGSAAERETSQALQQWLAKRGIPYRVHAFRSYPYLFEATGLWLIVSRTLLALAVWLRWGLWTLPIAILGLLGGTLDVAMHLPLVSWPGAKRGENILIEFDPPDPKREVVFCAHYDSKTELLDHHQRMFFLKNLRLGIVITLLLGLEGPLESWLRVQGSSWAAFIYWTGVALALVLLFLAWGLGLNLSTGRLLSPSQGAVDNGAACAILLGLAERIQAARQPHPSQPGGTNDGNSQREQEMPDFGRFFVPQHTRVTLALFTGEEVNMQGSRAYVRARDWPLPGLAINLEVMAQDGEYVFWEQDGNVFRLAPTSEEINAVIRSAVTEITGQPPRAVGPVNSDGSSFQNAGIPTGIMGTYDRRWVDTGFHQPSDNLGRVVMERLPEGVAILDRILQHLDQLP